MNTAGLRRRALLRGCLCCLGPAVLAGCESAGGGQLAPGYRPAAASTEGGLWHVMATEEKRLQASPSLIRDAAATAYLRDLCCRLAGEHCADIRVYLVRTPGFNASMAPNGMMQVWSGLLLRVHNDAQLAAILGHEIGHYIRRHSLARFEAMRNTADITAVIGLGLALGGAVGAAAGLGLQLGAVAGLVAYSREQETEADAIGLELMHRAGFTVEEAPKVWDNLMAEASRAEGGSGRDPLFATHPRDADRAAALRAAAQALPPNAGNRSPAGYAAAFAGIRTTLLQDEVRQRRAERSLEVFRRMEADGVVDGAVLTAWGEVHRLRDAAGDRPAARAAFERAIASGSAPPEAWRGLGLVLRREGDAAGARRAFEVYVARAPDAPDAPLMRGYMQGG